MSIVIRQFDKKETGIVFRHAVSGKTVMPALTKVHAGRLDAATWFTQPCISHRHKYRQ